MTSSHSIPRLPNRVIGTAGHVDHGKSTLVKALTGIDPDRLAEEKAREMTIDLGFAWFSLPNGQTIGVVDVPGHRDFIENMLAGIGGIDAVLFVIAADEGVMPQTREHLAIIDLLGIKNGLIVLTKIDTLGGDAELLNLLEDEIHQTVAPTSLADAPLIAVSALTGEGMPNLLNAITEMIHDLPARLGGTVPRLPIDRVFTMSGFGTVVTGTLIGGIFKQGDEVEQQPGGQRGRIRGLQSYRQTVDAALPGSRTAINVSGIEKNDLQRGCVLSRPGAVVASTLIDVRFRHLPDASRSLKHNAEVKVFVGTAETTGRVRLLTHDDLPPGEEAWIQLKLDAPIAAVEGDRFIVRYPSPGETIGGGVIVDPHPGDKWKRFQDDVIERLRLRAQGTPAQRLAQAADTPEPLKLAALKQRTDFDNSTFNAAVSAALAENLLIEFSDGTFLAYARWEVLVRALHNALEQFHQTSRLKGGMPREELRSRLGIKQNSLNVLLETVSDIAYDGRFVRRADHVIRFSTTEQSAVDRLMAQIQASPFSPPSWGDAAALVGEDVLYALIELGDIVQVSQDVIFSRGVFDEMVSGISAMLDKFGSVSASQVRDRFSTSRKYAIAFLEYLDTLGITRREGDARVRGARTHGKP